MRKLACILLPVLTLLSGCVSMESVNPLSSPRAAKADYRLEGMWRSKDDKSTSYLMLSYRKKGLGSLIYVSADDSGAIDTLREDFFVTHTAAGDYLNLTNGVYAVDGKAHRDHPGPYTFAKYRFSWLGRLMTAGINSDSFVTAVQHGTLKGKLTRDNKGNVTNLLLTDSSARILHFIESSKPGEIFAKETRFEKVGGK
ncbi:MAG TPA: hypothetical protein VHY22_14725 [Chthoniobacteraceae bacterium]|jgi:hypothetical protein|nr:hypothetical protein [Chthoniobacteraceae bacterium]